MVCLFISLAINQTIYIGKIECRSLRMLQLMIEGARLKMLMAWCSTLGGAHSSLGEHSLSHVRLHHIMILYPIFDAHTR